MPGFYAADLVKVTASTPADGSAAIDNATQAANKSGGRDLVTWSIQNLGIVKTGASASSNIVVAILLALAIMILAVMAVILTFVLRNLISQDMVPIGSLRATGVAAGVGLSY